MQEEMKSAGTLLREAREQRGVTIEQAAETTRISKGYLKAIEEDAYGRLPNIVYVKGFLRVYAGYLGLSGDEVLRLFEATFNPPSSEKVEQTERRILPWGRRTSNGSGKRWVTRSVPLFLAVMLAGYYLSHDEEGEKRASESAVTAAAVQPAPVQARQSSARMELTQQLPQSVTENQGDAPSTRPGNVLRLKANEECWLVVTIDENVSQTYQLKPGDLIEWIAERTFALDIGNAGGVEAEFNGKPLKQLGEKGKPAHVALSPEGVVER
ncbi:MAG: helix-turn-helix domain-containing protein [Geobacter sp.]|nr:helix-turn-helix domain-containing protein [Geobacter sp.]